MCSKQLYLHLFHQVKVKQQKLKRKQITIDYLPIRQEKWITPYLGLMEAR